MACPNCGCKVHYQFNSEDGFAGDDERLERCAACGAVFDIEDAADDDDETSPSIEREAAAPSIEVPPGMSRIDAFFWLEHRADVIEALAQKGLRVVSNADRVWLAPIEREVSGEASADGVKGLGDDR